MTQLSASEAREHFADTLNRVAYAGERIKLSRKGKDMAVLISIEDFEFLESMEDRVDIKNAEKAIKEPGNISWGEVKSKAGL